MRAGLRFEAGAVASAVSDLSAYAADASDVAVTVVVGAPAGRGVGVVLEEFADAVCRAARGMSGAIGEKAAGVRRSGAQIAATDTGLGTDARDMLVAG